MEEQPTATPTTQTLTERQREAVSLMRENIRRVFRGPPDASDLEFVRAAFR